MSKKTLVWMLAGGAALAIGGVAIWWWRRRSKAAKLDNPPAPDPDEEPLPKTETTTQPWVDLDLRAHTVTSQPKASASAADEQPSASVPNEQPAASVPDEQPAASEPEERATATEPEEQPPTSTPIKLATRPPTLLIPKRRRKRYPVGPGELIELRPDRVPDDASWSTSRPDVEIRVVEQTDARTVVALDGPAGEVNVALLREGPKGPRPITSWKFEIVDKVA